MNLIKNCFIFLVVFLIAGLAIHYASYRSFGLFIWSLGEDASGKTVIARTAIPSGRVVNVDEGSNDPGGEGKDPDTPDAAENSDPNVTKLFNGKDLGKWEKTEFGGEGDVFVNEDGNLEFGFGAIMTGVHWSEDPPARSNFEITLDAQRLDGNDFFLALTFPVKEDYATFVVGGWGGGIVGISSVDDLDASENETMNIEGFENDVWYKIKIQVTDEKLSAWIDDKQMVDLELKDRKISLRAGDIELCTPLGIASFVTRSQYRNMEWRNLDVSKNGEIKKPEEQKETESQNPEPSAGESSPPAE